LAKVFEIAIIPYNKYKGGNETVYPLKTKIMISIQELNNGVIKKWLKEANDKDLSIYCMMAMAQDSSSEIYALVMDKEAAIKSLRDLADNIESGEYILKNTTYN